MFTKSFYDMCVSQKCFEENNCHATLKQLHSYGYRTIAISHEAQETPVENENKKKKKKGHSKDNDEIIPNPIKLDKKISEEFSDMTILKRLTVIFSSSDGYHKMCKSTNFKKYDILALLPTTMPALMFACGNVEADILTMDPETKSQLKINRKIYNNLVNKGYFFEILYSPTIEDQTKRKNAINVSHLYHTFGKSKNIIMSSGATHIMYMRNPYDIINLGLIFGLNEQQSKDSVTHCPERLCTKAFGRCHGKSIMFVENTASEEQDPSLVEISEDVITMDVDQPATKKVKQ